MVLFDYKHLAEVAWPLMVVTLVLLLLVLVAGRTVSGAKRWLPVAGYSFQPSELAKIAMPVEEQVISLFAGTRGYMDAVPVEAVGKFEDGLLEYFRNAKSDILAEIREKAKLDDGLTAKLGAAIDEFKKGFKA